jgi:hypothetical protein
MYIFSVVDPDFIESGCRYGTGISIKRLRIPLQGFVYQKLKKITAEKIYLVLFKNCNMIIPRASFKSGEAFSPQKRTSSTFVGHFFVLLH